VDTIETILKAAAGRADEAEVYLSRSESVGAELSRDKVRIGQASHATGLGIRVFLDGRAGASSTNDPSKWAACLEAALAALRLADPQPWEGLPEPTALPVTPLAFDPAVTLAPATVAELLDAMKAGAAAHPAASVTAGSAGLSRSTIEVANTHDLRYTDEETHASCSIEAIAGTSTGYEFASSHGLDLDPAWVGEQAAFFAAHGAGGEALPSGTYDLVLSPLALAELLEAVLLPALIGRNVHAGRSRLAGRVGETILDPRLSLYDDPHRPMGPGAAWFDAEGVPTHRLDLVRDGVLSGFAYDLRTAYRYGATTTGSAVRGGYGGAPTTGFHTLVLEGPVADVMADEAIYVRSVVGAHTANTITGDFSVEVSNPSFVSGGAFTTPVRTAMWGGNVFDLLSTIEGVSAETRNIGELVLPALRVAGQQLVG
jgi:PmbA protein